MYKYQQEDRNMFCAHILFRTNTHCKKKIPLRFNTVKMVPFTKESNTTYKSQSNKRSLKNQTVSIIK